MLKIARIGWKSGINTISVLAVGCGLRNAESWFELYTAQSLKVILASAAEANTKCFVVQSVCV